MKNEFKKCPCHDCEVMAKRVKMLPNEYTCCELTPISGNYCEACPQKNICTEHKEKSSVISVPSVAEKKL